MGWRSNGEAPTPFVTLPTDCAAGPETAALRVDTWEEPGSVREGHYARYVEATTGFAGVTGCDLLGFGPSIEVQPEIPCWRTSRWDWCVKYYAFPKTSEPKRQRDTASA